MTESPAAKSTGVSPEVVDAEALLAEAERLRTTACQLEMSGNASKSDAITAQHASSAAHEKALDAIAAGATTGDFSRDLALLSGGDSRFNYDNFYADYRWLISAMAGHASEVIVLTGGSEFTGYHFTMAVVPLDARPHFRTERQFGRADQLALSVPGSYSWDRNSRRHLASEPMIIKPGSGGLRELPEHLVVGPTAVAEWFQALPLDQRFAAWVGLRHLAWPVEPDAELALNIRDRREAMIVQLLAARTELVELEVRLKRWQEQPARFFEQRNRQGGVDKTADGVTINFGLAGPIAAAAERLKELVDTADEELLMSGNPTWQSANTLVAPKSSPISPN